MVIYDCYTVVSGLNINVRKLSALCISSSPELVYDLQQWHTVELGKTFEDTKRKILQKINTKALRRILARVAAAYHTRIRDGIAIQHNLCSFRNTYHIR
jgi:hypothetical protein